MYFDTSRETILPALRMVAGVVERKQTMPILSNVLVRVSGNNLYMCATDSELEVTCSLPLQGDLEGNDGETTIPAVKLFDICRSLAEDAHIQFKQENNQVVVQSGRSRFALACLPAEDFPSSESLEATFEFETSQEALKNLLSRTQFAMAQQDVRYYLNGLLLDLTGNELNMVATDGHRLALASDKSLQLGSYDPLQVIVPRKAVLELARILEEKAEPVQVSIGSHHVRFSIRDITLTSKLIDGRFPDYYGVLPDSPDNFMTADCDLLKQALTRAAILSNEKLRSVRLSVSPDSLMITANNPEQEVAEESMDVSYQGESFEIGFNVTYLLDALTAADSNKVVFGFTSTEGSCLVQPEGNDNVKYVVMPMRL
ncbi:MAG: DNA polymerase III subunit beta [Pseudomonadota bacterium]